MVKWSILCESKMNDDFQITKIKVENKIYLLCLGWEFASGKMTWAELMRLRFLKSKY